MGGMEDGSGRHGGRMCGGMVGGCGRHGGGCGRHGGRMWETW